MEDIKYACLQASSSASGPDGLVPGEMKLFSDNVFANIADLLNKIEKGAAWPDNTYIARAAFLEKDPERRGDPGALRVLLMLSPLYRRWATARLSSLQPWVDTWADDIFCCGRTTSGSSRRVYALITRHRGVDLN